VADSNECLNIKIANRCPVAWEDMIGKGNVRKCRECELNIYDLSGLSADEAPALILSREKTSTKRLYRRADGRFMVQNCPSSVWRDCFGPGKDEIWHRLSSEIDGTFVESTWVTESKIVVEHKNWLITLDTFYANKHVYTRLRAPFVNRVGFSFDIYRKTSMDDFAKLFGMQDIEIGDPRFDDEFIIKSNDERRVRQLLTPSLRNLFISQPENSFGISVRDDEGWFSTKFPQGVDELYFSAFGLITNKQRLKQLFQIFAATLDQLNEMGAATNDDPKVILD
jgi:hypothetical protein